jgi:DNA-directed RNA polymerase subunit E'/Rpb7
MFQIIKMFLILQQNTHHIKQNDRLTTDSVVRLKIIGTRLDASEIFAIGSIKEDYLGLISCE